MIDKQVFLAELPAMLSCIHNSIERWQYVYNEPIIINHYLDEIELSTWIADLKTQSNRGAPELWAPSSNSN